MATTPPPEWIFTEEVPEKQREALQEDMEKVRAFFADQYGVEASDFIVVAGNVDAVSAHSRRLTGQPAPHKWVGAWIDQGLDGRAFMGVVWSGDYGNVSRVMAHEYFHILQGTIIGDSRYIPVSSRIPLWLVEGHAEYASHLYSQDEALARWVLDHISMVQLERPGVALGDLRQVDTFWNDPSSSNNRYYVYGVGLAAAQYLGDPTYLEFWKALGKGLEWKEALRHVSGVDFDEFNRSFKEWLPSHVPRMVQVAVQARWPGMGSPALRRTDHLKIGIEWVPNWPFPTMYSNWSGQTKLTTAYSRNTASSGYVCLMWKSAEDDYPIKVIGWYSDGKLVSREDAELIEFTGESIALKEWSLPGHPDTLQAMPGQHCH